MQQLFDGHLIAGGGEGEDNFANDRVSHGIPPRPTPSTTCLHGARRNG